jgi:hypothetical protein
MAAFRELDFMEFSSGLHCATRNDLYMHLHEIRSQYSGSTKPALVVNGNGNR